MDKEIIKIYDTVSIIVLHTNQILISKIEEVSVDIGEPNCRLIDPYVINYDKVTQSATLTQWLIPYTSQNVFMISSDKILTISEPKQQILDKYNNLVNS
jgi:hypothetical protein